MKTFRDTAGREWAITVDVNAIKRVLKAPIEHLGEPVKVNLLELVDPDGDLLKKVVAYPPLVCDIAYALCKPQCDEKNVGDEEFGRAMGGDVLERVLDLLIEETVDFFPQGRRAVLKKVLSKSQAFAEKARTLIETRLAAGELDAAIDAILEPELKRLQGIDDGTLPPIGTGSAGNLPASSASTPAQEPSPS
jgi:hypothetical protein